MARSILWRSVMRRLSTATAAIALAALALGIAVIPLQAPLFTRILASQYSLADDAGLPPETMLGVAENVRAFVVEGEGELPTQVEGRPGFDGEATAHLVDVRVVLKGGRMATLVLAAALALWGLVSAKRGRAARAGDVMRSAAVATVALPLAAAVGGMADFDGLFAAFHGLFFTSGTWVFPADSLLIRTFPEPFWIAAGIAWAVLVGVIAACYWLTGAWLGRFGGPQS